MVLNIKVKVKDLTSVLSSLYATEIYVFRYVGKYTQSKCELV